MKGDLLTKEEAAKYLGLQPSTLMQWRWNKKEILPAVKIGRSIKYLKEDLDAFIMSKRTVNE